MIDEITTPVLVAQALQGNTIPRNDIKDLRIKWDERSSTHRWWIVCNSIRAHCQLPLVRCLTKNEAFVTMERIQKALTCGRTIVDADEEHIQAVCSILIDWEAAEYVDANP